MSIPFAVVALLAGLALTGRATGGNWLAPAAIFPLIWAVLVLVAAALQGGFPLQPAGLWVIVSMLVSFQVGALMVDYGGRRSRLPAPAPVVDDGFREAVAVRLARATAVTTLLAVIGVLGLVWMGAATFGVGLSLTGLIRLGNLFSVMRYGGVGDLPVAVRAFLYWTFPAALLGGMLAAVAGTRPRRLLSVLPVLVSLAGGMVVAARAGFLLSLFMWIAGFWAAQICVSRGTYNLFRARWLTGFAALALSLVGMSVVVQFLRAGIWRRFELDVLADIAVAAFFGSISAFTTWFPLADLSDLALGAFTFAGPFDLFGLASRVQGLYQGVVYFPTGDSSNIYTAFRGLMQDFGLVGAWSACFAAGVLSSIAYRRCAAGRIQYAVPLSAFYAAALFSHLYSVFLNNSVTMGWVIAAVVTLWPTRLWNREARPEGSAPSRVQRLA